MFANRTFLSGLCYGAALLCAALLLQSCAAPEARNTLTAEKATPKTPATRAQSRYGESLRCLDRMLEQTGMRAENAAGIPVRMLVGIPSDSVGNSAGLREMLLTALYLATKRSRYLLVSDYMDKDLFQTTFYGGRVSGSPAPPSTSDAMNLTVEDLYITGAVTQSDKNVDTVTAGGGIGFDGNSIGAGYENGTGTVAVDLRLSRMNTYLINSVSNLAVVEEKDKSVEAEISIGKFGAGGEFGWATKEGAHAAVRMLVELSVAELLGEYAQIPYWECLSVPESNPEVRRRMADWFEENAREGKLRAFFDERLRRTGDYDAANSFPEALAHFQRRHNIAVSGDMSFEAFTALVKDTGEMQAKRRKSPRNGMKSVAVNETAAPVSAKTLTQLKMEKTARPDGSVTVRLETDAPAHLWCYYGDRQGRVSRIYPNPARPQSYVTAKSVTVPQKGAPFAIKPGEPDEGPEPAVIVCAASSSEKTGAQPELTPQPGKYGLPLNDGWRAVPDLLRAADPEVKMQAAPL